ncbi:alpha/beta hydrolase [Nostoc sp. FACHB-152]|uniref:alpha/beta hydrolase n=1 Tax=unclassified Nostoc TaxID=2593658 RepID=UPI001687A15B|nr:MULTISPECIES: alpha/beta hydrolase [unclassified Nostoc]MBD2450157.1 alpha/beta hydrolase [Nostoc sp. FACHB-152]MBD2471340.1 alpha/beta hydrolase [Nostoc sp. FACHB-145]
MRMNWRSLNLLAGCFCAIAFAKFLGVTTSAKAAETVVLRYGLLAESVSLAELQKAAEMGDLPKDFKIYGKSLSTQQRRFLVDTLRNPIPMDVVTVNRLLNTQIGTTILNDFSKAVVRKDKAGVQAIRAGLVLGSTAPQGFSLLSFIANYPSQRLEIDLPQAFKISKSLNTGFWQTQQFMLAIAPLFNQQKLQVSLPFDPSQPGTDAVQVLQYNWHDQQRNRKIPVDVYWSSSATTAKPVIIFSHGLGSVRTDLRYLAQHLASYGYVVAAVEHPGSNQTNTDFGFKGKNRLLKPQEFLERPQDISFVLDELAKINQTANNPLAGKLATDNAMIVGYSFGGGTALALAGAEFQLDKLKQRCQQNLAIFSLGETAQCVAQELPKNSYLLRDNRIKQAIALSPTTSLIFGETGLTKVQVPTLILANSADKTTPALSEQVMGFQKLPTPKWLVGVLGGTHLSVKDPSTTLDQVGVPNTPFSGGEVVGDQAADVRKLVKTIVLAMAAQLTPEAKQYAIFLTPNYAQAASTKAFPFRLVTEIPPDALKVLKDYVEK